MSERDAAHEALLEALSSAEAQTAAAAWNECSEGWDRYPLPIQQAAIAAALRSGYRLTRSAARRFLTDRWNGLPDAVQRRAIETLRAALEEPGVACETWSFITDHRARLPGVLDALLTPDVLRASLGSADFSAEAWEFLTEHWDRLPAPLRSAVEPQRISAAMQDPCWQGRIALWEFLNENWPHLPRELQAALTPARVQAAAGDPGTRFAISEFIEAHAAELTPEVRRAAHVQGKT